ncbi:MAG: rhodanese-like domain-containing protein [Ignavibacteriales bacterium]|nr:rhodanese-like domain-containing protein [Ignavibacteriales bacterium]
MNDHLKNFGKEIAGILLLSVVLAFVYNYFSPKGISLIRKELPKEATSDAELFPTPLQPVEPASKDSVSQSQKESSNQQQSTQVIEKKPVQQKVREIWTGIKIISVEQFERLVLERQMLILDAREPDEYKKGRVPGAINIPYLQVDNYFEQLAMFPRDTTVAIYCNNLMCPLGRGLAEFMEQLEFKRLLLFEEGWDRWEREELPIEK